jgi:ABC-type sugar transport system ATPase subunit
MAAISLQHVTKRFAPSTPRSAPSATAPAAVTDLSLEIADGELCVLVGPSGCGKSTTLRMIAGLEQPSSGVVRIGDRDVTHLPPAERDVAMVFQSYALYPHMSVRENLSFGLRVRRTPRAEIQARVDEATAFLGLESLLDRRPAQLSGGERQRVAMGRALVRRPAVFLFDEPLSNLDARLRLEVRKELARIHRKLGATMVYVTHDQAEAMTLADRMVVMRDGVAIQIGAPMDVYRQPATRFVGEFLGTPPMSFLSAAALGDASGDTQAAGGSPPLVGVRAEDVSFARRASDDLELRATVELCESLGGETLVTLICERGGSLIARLAGEDTPPAIGASCTAFVPPRRLHRFDARSGRRIVPGDAAGVGGGAKAEPAQ